MSLGEEDFFTEYFEGYPIEPTAANIALAREFLLEKWQERHRDLGLPSPVPEDLSDSCKFSALFGTVVFGADIGGNYDHVHNVLDDGAILDLNAAAADVSALRAPYRQDPEFLLSWELRDSLQSCAERVKRWVEEFDPVANAPSP